MSTNPDPTMPPDFTPGRPPDDRTWLAVRDTITTMEGHAPPHPGRHCVVEIWRRNPISGYRVKLVKVAD